MANVNAVWGIEVGQCALKAVRLRRSESGGVELLAFDSVDHSKILSQPDADPDALISESLEKFASRNEFGGDVVVIGVPGQQTFARFCKLPPVEKKKIPEIVRFEASQQIPFDISEVVWDYEVFQDEDMPDVEVGIFAMRQDLVRKHLRYYTEVGLSPTMIQTVPSAVYNFSHFELVDDLEEGEAVVVIDVGAQHTDLIVIEQNSAWSRNIPLGGNSFTEALVTAFKLNFAKAEELKRKAASSKYARQVFQAMRPVFADLVAEIQRSIGFYSSTHRDIELKHVLACGNAFALPGLQKYLENNLTISGGVKRLEKFNKLDLSLVEKSDKFLAEALTFGPAYGLALQGLGLAKIRANLLPPELARVQRWKKKTPYWIAAAACLGLAAAFPWVRQSMDAGALAGAEQEFVGRAQSIVRNAEQLQNEYRQVSSETDSKMQQLREPFDLQRDRAVVPRIVALVHEALPEIDAALAGAASREELQRLIEQNPQRFARVNRGQMTVEGFDVIYTADLANEQADSVRTTSGVLPPPQPQDRPGAAAGAMGGMPGGMPGGPPGIGGGRAAGNPRAGGGGGSFGRGAPDPFSGFQSGQQQQQPDPFGTGGGASDPGFVVVIEGRLLFGERHSDAFKFLKDRFATRLRELSQREGLGFHIPRDEEGKSYVASRPNVEEFVAGVTNATAMGAVGPDGEQAVLYPDPTTGESMTTDWKYRMWFKLRMGDAPPAPEAAEGAPPQEPV